MLLQRIFNAGSRLATSLESLADKAEQVDQGIAAGFGTDGFAEVLEQAPPALEYQPDDDAESESAVESSEGVTAPKRRAKKKKKTGGRRR